jgi:hypothetical protein
MKNNLFLAAIVVGLALVSSARAATQSDSFTYVGGALNPNTYSALGDPAKYRPPTLFPDATANHGASIGVTGATSGGLGSSSFPDGYEFYYTFFSPSVSFTLQTATVIAGIDKITISFNSGGGTTFNATSLALNFNTAHASESATTFTTSFGGTSDFGDLTNYSWTWNVGSFGASSGFTAGWASTGPHTTFADIQLVQQSVPEPSSLLLATLGLAGLCGFRQVRRRSE